MSLRSVPVRLVIPVAVALLLLASPAPAQIPAQSAAPEGEPTAQDLAVLLAVLEDEEARAELISQLRALEHVRARSGAPSAPEAPAPAQGAGPAGALLDALSARLQGFGATASALADELGDPGRSLAWLERQAREPARRTFWLRAFLTVAAALAAGIAAAFAVTRILRRPRAAFEGRVNQSALARGGLLLLRLPLDLLPILAFGAAAYGALALLQPERPVRLVTLAVVNAAVIARAALAVVRMAMTPLSPSLRLLPLSDETAAYAFVWMARFVNVGVYGYFLAEAARLLGVPAASHAAILHLAGLFTAVLGMVLVLQLRAPVASVIRGDGRGPRGLALARARLADVWHVLAILYLVAAYTILVLRIEGGFAFVLRGTIGTVIAFGGARLLALAVAQALERVFRVRGELRMRFPELQERASRYLPFARGLLFAGIGAGAVLVALEAWRIDAFGALATASGRSLLTSLGRIVLILVVALAAWEAARLFVGRRLGADGGRAAASQRLRTLLPLARSALLVLIVTLTVMTVLSELGMEIGPLLAGAGVVGLAIGFGAQTLVKDVITGAFILFEDAISVGDVVEVAGHAGLVEAISVRSIRHRDLSGTVHTIPFSSVDVVRNLTKDFSYYLMDIGVAYREDPDEVMEVMREVLEAQRADPGFGGVILDPLEIMGVNDFGDSAVVIRARIKTRPLEQWRVGRDYRRRLKKRFDERGIEIPFPHRTLYFGMGKDGSAPPARLRMAGDEAGSRARDAAE